MYTNDERFAILHTPGSNTWTLQIKFVQRRDHGMYECQVSNHFKLFCFVSTDFFFCQILFHFILFHKWFRNRCSLHILYLFFCLPPNIHWVKKGRTNPFFTYTFFLMEWRISAHMFSNKHVWHPVVEFKTRNCQIWS